MLAIYGHPFASFCWKVYIAARERGVAYEARMVDPDHPENSAFVAAAAPTGQFPVLVHDGRTVIESAAIIEYLDLNFGDAPPMVPEDRRKAIEARQMDGLFGDYLARPLTDLVLDALRPEDQRDAMARDAARSVLDRSYAWLDRWMAGRDWAANETFGIADCAAAPALFYAHWGHPIPEEYAALRAYRARLLARPSVAATVDDARYFRPNFPLKGLADPD